MEHVEAALLLLKEQALLATRNHDGDFYNHYLDDSAVAVVPFGVFRKAAIIQQMADAASPFRSMEVSDTQAIALTPESGIVTYRATFPAANGKPPSTAFVTTVYAKKNGEWKGVFYQQTPLPAARDV
jgi:hypothetical protein